MKHLQDLTGKQPPGSHRYWVRRTSLVQHRPELPIDRKAYGQAIAVSYRVPPLPLRLLADRFLPTSPEQGNPIRAVAFPFSRRLKARCANQRWLSRQDKTVH